MTENASQTDQLVQQAAQGDEQALAALFSRFRERLMRMVQVRLNAQLQGRIDASDVVQEAYLEAARRLDEYLSDPAAPFFLWIRSIASQKLIDVHRRHLGAEKRNAKREISLQQTASPEASSASLAAQLCARRVTPSQAVAKAEMKARVEAALDRMSASDREVLALRHFEQLTNAETAHVLGLSESGAMARYLRALKRLKNSLSEYPEFFDQ